MKTIGITGGIGAGKTQILEYIKEKYDCEMILADKLAYELECPGHECYDHIVDLLGEQILREDGFIDKNKMASAIFADETIVEKVNSIIHPAVKKEILFRIDKCRAEGKKKLFFVEAALLIEEGYDLILDELWYIYASEDVRRSRLKQSRGYSDEKIDSILSKQLRDEEFRSHCRITIDNSGDLTDTYKQIDDALMDI